MRIAFIGDTSSCNAKTWLAGLRAYGITDIHVWPACGFARDLLRLPQIKKWLGRLRPDLVLGYRTTSYGFLAVLAAGVPVVVAAQGETDLWPYHPLSLPLKRFTKRVAVRRAALIHAWGKNMVPSLLQHGARPDKILVLPRGVDLPTFIYRETPATLTLVSTRSLYPEYHHEISLQVVAELNRAGLPGRLVLLGSGPQKKQLQTLAAKLGITRLVSFAGQVDQAQLAGILAGSAFYLSFPETEGTSASLLEAMACGCYPLVSNLPANRNWLESGHNGMLSSSPTELAQHLRQVHTDRQRYLQAVRYNRQLIENKADVRKNMSVFVQHYQILLDRGQA